MIYETFITFLRNDHRCNKNKDPVYIYLKGQPPNEVEGEHALVRLTQDVMEVHLKQTE